jgi:phage gp29-like protein
MPTKADLTREIAAATVGGVRSPLTGYPGDGLTPERLASILRAADAGDPRDYLELAETVEERDPHYTGVLGTRRRAVSQLEVTAEAASDEPLAVEMADRVSAWLKRDELSEELFDLLDAVGKGYSFTEIVWDVSSGFYEPALAWRDPRWFTFDRTDLSTPLLLDDHGTGQPLPAFKFIVATMKAKSGLAVRGGLARPALWTWMFKAFTQRDWAIFVQNYGQPVRLGKYGAGASPQDRATLFRAVANIGGDMAAIIPESMQIEFIEAANLGAGHQVYKERADWLDQQVSKLVLGQTATTDSLTGGLGSGKEHRQVQEDIERADARQLSGILNRDLIGAWMMLEGVPREHWPRLKIGRPEQADVKMMVDAVAQLAPLGLKVGQRQMRELIGLGAPEDDDEVLSSGAVAVDPAQDPAEFTEALAAKPPRPKNLPQPGPKAGDAIADAALSEKPGDAVLASIAALVAEADSFEALRASIETAMANEPPERLTAVLREAMLLAELTGRVEMMETPK